MDKTTLRQHLLAGSVHLLASAIVAAMAVALIFLAWYPSPLAGMMGVDQLLLILIGVDVVLGPVMTTLLFDRRKGKWLLLDLGIIAALQLGALFYGLHSIYGGRPAMIVFNVDRFDAVQAFSMDAASLETARQRGDPGLPWLKPRIVASLMPTDPKEREKVMDASLSGGADIPELAEYYVPYEKAAATAAAKARPLAELKGANDMDEAAWQAFLQSLPLPEPEAGYLPLKGREVDGIVIVSRKTGAILQMSPLLPKWTAPTPPSGSG